MTVEQVETGLDPTPLRWTLRRSLELVESGVIHEGRGIELIDGQVMQTMPQGELHPFLFFALQAAFETMETARQGVRSQPTIILGGHDVYDPEFALIRREALGQRGLPSADDVLWIVEVSVSSRMIDLGPKQSAYARVKIPEHWVFDAIQRGVWVFTDPVEGEYRNAVFVPAGESVEVPTLGKNLDTATIFPPA